MPELRERNGRQSRHSVNPRVGPGQVYWNVQEISQARPRLLSLRVGCDPSFEGWGAWRIHAFCYFGWPFGAVLPDGGVHIPKTL